MYPKCMHITKCSDSLFVSFTYKIIRQDTRGRYYIFTEDTTYDKIMNKDNYTEISHHHQENIRDHESLNQQKFLLIFY